MVNFFLVLINHKKGLEKLVNVF